ncbi:hypothetical protein HPB52_018650 [Rhipicephalus sanguineus]|uniref:Uncharacterized protein n=1 Tax=Rhipicephalus sanguineus TaxID=34632 RepID=A0A9D4PHL0_RHISA|nr:hypothetical protein HPB52_018650 [Rhipicephalus sanguineus]
MYTNVDICGVPRGRCGREVCDCEGFARVYTEAHGGASAVAQSGWCCYCGHPPANHSRFDRNMFGRQEIFSVSWHGARPPLLDLPTRRELNRISQEAQPTMHEVIVLEPDAEMHETATPDNETTEGMTQPAEKGQLDRDAGQKRKRSDEVGNGINFIGGFWG